MKLLNQTVGNMNILMSQKKNKQCEIYSPFQHFYGRGFTFMHNSRNIDYVRFKDDNFLLISTFYYDEADYNMHNYYRDFNLTFTFHYKKNFNSLEQAL